MTEAERVLRELASAGARRDDGVLAFGGGVVGDLAGFCAATYQRGVPVDPGADDPRRAGRFRVRRQDRGGPARGQELRRRLPHAARGPGRAGGPGDAPSRGARGRIRRGGEDRAHRRRRALGASALARGRRARQTLGALVFDCALTKIDVVAQDERDAGRRQVLNLGHTVGHAIEAASGYARYRHGEAVALGLVAALRISGADELRDEVEGLLARAGLPDALDSAVETDAVMAALATRQEGGCRGVPFVLIERPGEPVIGARLDGDMVRSAVEELR